LFDGSIPVLLAISFKFPLAVEKESEEEVLIVGLFLFEAILANGGSDASHGNGGCEFVENTFDGDEVCIE
jgi:hypothetical protein